MDSVPSSRRDVSVRTRVRGDAGAGGALLASDGAKVTTEYMVTVLF